MQGLYDVDLTDYIDDNFNYHYMESGPCENKFDNYTYNSLQYLKGAKTILDVGCGYGGPAKFIKKHNPDCSISCVTNSISQYQIVSQSFDCTLTDAINYSSQRSFDVAVFYDSLCHMDAERTLMNISKHTDRILIKDYTFFGADYYYSTRWEMSFRSEDNWKRLLSSIGFKIKHYGLNHNVLIEQSHLFWNQRVKDSTSSHRQISLMKQIPKSPKLNQGKAHCVIYCERSWETGG